MASLRNPAAKHVVGSVRGVSGTIAFACHGELCIPWRFLLSKEDFHILRTYFHYCCFPGQMRRWAENLLLHPRLRWYLHCHCRNPGSLQCRAAAAAMMHLFDILLQGTRFNSVFPFYRAFCNRGGSDICKYLGSTIVLTAHVIYIKFKHYEDARHCCERVAFGREVEVRQAESGVVYAMIICRECPRELTTAKVRRCACRTRRVLRKCHRAIEDYRQTQTRLPRRVLPSRSEARRLRLLSGFYQHGGPLYLWDFNKD